MRRIPRKKARTISALAKRTVAQYQAKLRRLGAAPLTQSGRRAILRFVKAEMLLRKKGDRLYGSRRYKGGSRTYRGIK